MLVDHSISKFVYEFINIIRIKLNVALNMSLGHSNKVLYTLSNNNLYLLNRPYF